MIMGAIIGGAIGSVIGASLKSKKAQEDLQEAPKQKKHEGILSRIFRRKTPETNILVDIDELRKIPHE